MDKMDIYNKEIDIFELFENNDYALEYFKKKNIKDSNEIRFNDLLEILKGSRRTDIITKYVKIKNNGFKEFPFSKAKPNLIKRENKKSIWNLLKKTICKDLNVRKLICEMIKDYDKYDDIDIKRINQKYGRSLEDYIVSINNTFKIQELGEKIYLYHDIFHYQKLNDKFINNISYDDFIRGIKDLKPIYILPFLRKSYSTYLIKLGISRGEDLINYLTKGKYDKEYNELIYLTPLLKYKFKGDMFIDKYIQKEQLMDDVYIFMMRVKNIKIKDIICVCEKKEKEVVQIIDNIINKFSMLFDSYNGILFVKYLMTFENGFITKEKLTKILPK